MPDDLPFDTVHAESPHTPYAPAMLATPVDPWPYTTEHVQYFAHAWEDHFFLLRNPHETAPRARLHLLHRGPRHRTPR